MGTCYIPKLENFMYKKDILETLKSLSLAYQCAFYRPENNTKGEPQGTEVWRSWYAKMK